MLFTSPSHPLNILNRLNHQRQDGNPLCDLIINVRGHRFPAHKAVLMASSKHLERQLRKLKKAEYEINVELTDIGNFERVLSFLYTAEIEVTEASLVEIIMISSVLRIPDLAQITSEFAYGLKRGTLLDTKNDSHSGNVEIATQQNDGEYEIHLDATELPPNEDVGEQITIMDVEDPYLVEQIVDQSVKEVQKEVLSKSTESELLVQLTKAAAAVKRENLSLAENKKELDRFYCQLCNRQFKRQNTYNSHLLLKHPAENGLLPIQGIAQRHGADTESAVVATTELGTYKTATRRKAKGLSLGGADDNFEIQQNLSCALCGKTFETPDEFKTHREEPCVFTCHFCKQNFKQKAGLRRHVRLHTGDSPFQCLLCNRRFTRKDQLKTHNLRRDCRRPVAEDTDPKLRKCPRCYKTFLTIAETEAHKPLCIQTCPICSKLIGNKADLKRHLRMHTGEKPYSCNVCGSSFSRPDALKRHYDVRSRMYCGVILRKKVQTNEGME